MFNGEELEVGTEQYVNRTTGQLLIGKAALELSLEQSQGFYTEDCATITDAISEMSEKPFRVMPRLKFETDDRAALLANGRWLLGLTNRHGPIRRVTYDSHEQLRTAGLSASVYQLVRQFGSFANYQRELGFAGERRISTYAHFTHEDYVNWAREQDQALTPAEVDEKFLSGDGPSRASISREFGGITYLFREAGLSEQLIWSREKSIAFSGEFAEVNFGMIPSRNDIQVLSNLGHTPSRWQFQKYFKVWHEYTEAAQGFIAAEKAKKENFNARTFEWIGKNHTDPVVRKISAISDPALRLRCALQYQVFRTAFGSEVHMSPAFKDLVLQGSSETFLRNCAALSGGAKTIEDIVQIGIDLGIARHLWPPKPKDHLRIYSKDKTGTIRRRRNLRSNKG